MLIVTSFTMNRTMYPCFEARNRCFFMFKLEREVHRL